MLIFLVDDSTLPTSRCLLLCLIYFIYYISLFFVRVFLDAKQSYTGEKKMFAVSTFCCLVNKENKIVALN